jgi:acyl-coenzyme A synthetase/AMP-(fatty) acid ligase
MRSAFIGDWVVEHAERDPEAPAVDGLQCRLSYGALAVRVRELAASLAAQGVTGHDRVLVALPSSPAAAVASLAVQTLGACAVEVDRGMGAAGLETVVAQARPRHAIVVVQDAKQWSEVLRDASLDAAWVLSTGGRTPATAAIPARLLIPFRPDGTLDPGQRGGGGSLPPHPRREDAPALVIYTSGSTGKPRGVIHTFRNIAANTRSIVEYLRLGPDERAMAILPFHYTYGKSILQTHLYAGGSLFVDNRFMYPRTVMEAIGTERCTSFAGVPATYEILRREVDLRQIPMSSLRYVTQAGGAMRPDTVRWAREAFAPARLFVMYGQTEATARLSFLPPERGPEKTGSIGIPIPGVELRVVDDAGAPVPHGQVGHLVARGDNVTPGYLDAPEETAAILRGGWLWTGDLARCDEDGFFWVVGRRDELLKIGGHRVSVNEIETLLLEHPAVRDAAVVGIDDPLQGTIAVAYVVAASPSGELDGELRRMCRDRGGPHKVPARLVFVDAVPRNPSGKALKAQLVARARAEREGTVTP